MKNGFFVVCIVLEYIVYCFKFFIGEIKDADFLMKGFGKVNNSVFMVDYHAFRNFHVFHFLISFSLEVFLISLCLYYSNSMSKTSRYNGTYAKDDGAKLKVYFQIEKALKKMLICCFEGT